MSSALGLVDRAWVVWLCWVVCEWGVAALMVWQGLGVCLSGDWVWQWLLCRVVNRWLFCLMVS